MIQRLGDFLLKAVLWFYVLDIKNNYGNIEAFIFRDPGNGMLQMKKLFMDESVKVIWHNTVLNSIKKGPLHLAYFNSDKLIEWWMQY